MDVTVIETTPELPLIRSTEKVWAINGRSFTIDDSEGGLPAGPYFLGRLVHPLPNDFRVNAINGLDGDDSKVVMIGFDESSREYQIRVQELVVR